jgi:ABC-type multidrug transport system fused ATPase/permease subunit
MGSEQADPLPDRPRPTPAALSFGNVGPTYPDIPAALTDIDLAVRRGEFVAVVDPSGRGKSTLLRIASGLLEATTGVVDVNRDHLGYVLLDATLLPWRTVAESLGLLAELRGVERVRRHEISPPAWPSSAPSSMRSSSSPEPPDSECVSCSTSTPSNPPACTAA